MKKYFPKFSKLRVFSSLVLVLSLVFAPLKPLFALDAPIQSLDVNGVNIYNLGGGYNDAHGIAGISFDVASHTLTMNNASVERIHSSGDLDINLVGTNSITATTDSSALLAMGGDLTITGDLASLTISALASNQPAITIGAGGRLTIGAAGTAITVTVAQGVLMNCEDTFIVDGNTFNTPIPEGPGGPPPGAPIQISVGDSVVIDETSDPQVTSASGIGWTIEYNEYGGYQFNIDATVSSTFGPISGNGEGVISINAIGGDITIQENLGLSVNFQGNVIVLFGLGEMGDVYLNGGIFTEGMVAGGDSDVFIGTTETPSPFGVKARNVSLNFGSMTINTTGTALSYYNPTPLEGEGMGIQVRQGAKLTVQTSNYATEYVNTATVFGGGTLDLSYTNALGDFIPQSGYWEWAEFTGTEMENTEPTLVTCLEGTDANNKYFLTISTNNFLLQSTSKPLFQLGFNYDDSEDSRVVNGTVNVIAANGYKFVSGGFYDFSIEEGTEVTIELLPNYGYQYVSGGINGVPTSPEAGRAAYTFVMPSNHVHISAIFEKTSDIVNIDTSKVAGASFTMPLGEINGNAELVVDDASVSNQEQYNSALGDFKAGSYLDLSLNEVIYKGSTEEAWKTSISELEQDTTVTLTLGDDLKGHAEYKVIRDHEGSIEKLDAVYNPSTGTITFNTDAYSTYVIGYNDPVNPNTFDGLFGSFALGLTSILGLCGLQIYSKKKEEKEFTL